MENKISRTGYPIGIPLIVPTDRYTQVTSKVIPPKTKTPKVILTRWINFLLNFFTSFSYDKYFWIS